MKRFLIALCLAAATACAPVLMSTQVSSEIDRMSKSGLLVDNFMVTGNSHAKHLMRLERWLEGERKVSVDYAVDLGAQLGKPGVVGYTSCEGIVEITCGIVLEKNMDPNMQFTTLLHESVHTMAGPQVNGISETLAETVAWRAGKEVGLDTTRESLSYLAMIPSLYRETAYDLFKERIKEWVDMLVRASR